MFLVGSFLKLGFNARKSGFCCFVVCLGKPLSGLRRDYAPSGASCLRCW
jgi:hypothetical protein